jgi:hypothetical protein
MAEVKLEATLLAVAGREGGAKNAGKKTPMVVQLVGAFP